MNYFAVYIENAFHNNGHCQCPASFGLVRAMTIYATLRRHGTGDILRMVVTCVNFNLLVLFIRRKVNQFSHEKPHLFQRVDEQPILFGTVWNCLELFGTWNLELFGTVWNLELFGTWNCLELVGTVWNCLELFGTVWNCL